MEKIAFQEPDLSVIPLNETDETLAGHVTSLREDWGGGDFNNFKINSV